MNSQGLTGERYGTKLLLSLEFRTNLGNPIRVEAVVGGQGSTSSTAYPEFSRQVGALVRLFFAPGNLPFVNLDFKDTGIPVMGNIAVFDYLTVSGQIGEDTSL